MNSISANKGESAQYRAKLTQIERLLGSDPALADQQAAALLTDYPGHPIVLLYQGIARRLQNNAPSAIAILQPLSVQHPNAPMVHLHLGLALRENNQNEAAIDTLRRAVAVKSDYTDAWLALADLHTALHDTEGACAAFRSYAKHALTDPRLCESAQALREQRYTDAEPLLRTQLQYQPNDIVALCMLAEVIEQQGRTNESEALLERCLDLAPDYLRARQNYALLLLRHNRAMDAMRETDRLLAQDQGNPAYRKLRAAISINLRNYEESIRIYRSLLDEFPQQPDVWTSLGHALKSVGRREECLQAYRKAIAVEPGYGEAYWAIANTKTERFTGPEITAMRSLVNKPDMATADRIRIHFALGKALEDNREYADSFQHYAAGNQLQHQSNRYNRDEFTAYVQRSKHCFTYEFFSERIGCGVENTEPIFIVGMPRSGTTLVEQILASHSSVEGTTELPEIIAMAKSLAAWKMGDNLSDYPEVLTRLNRVTFRELGAAYIEQTRSQRKYGRPMFIDKMPENFVHIGLIHLILPRSRIIDVRRHPLASGFSMFKQFFARGQEFSYSLEDIGSYYRNYVELMAHFDRVLPGRVYRIFYESLVQDTEHEVRRLLQYCNLPFEAACLEFHNNARAVTTPSAEQVRKPIYKGALENWAPYSAWLGPLQDALGQLVDDYPDIPMSWSADEQSTH